MRITGLGMCVWVSWRKYSQTHLSETSANSKKQTKAPTIDRMCVRASWESSAANVGILHACANEIDWKTQQ